MKYNNDQRSKCALIKTGKGLSLALLLFSFPYLQEANAQEKRTLTVQEAVNLGIENSKTLKVSSQQIEEAQARFNQAKDGALPTVKASYGISHVNFLSTKFELPGSSEVLHLPSSANTYMGTLSVQELIFGGNQLKYAKESTRLLTDIARLDLSKNQDEVAYTIIQEYYNLYKVQQSLKVVEQNLKSVGGQIKQAEQFFKQGIVTKNDVLRFQLQKDNISLTGVDLETNKRVINYNLNILLGLSEGTEIAVSDVSTNQPKDATLNGMLDSALAGREELKQSELRTQLAETNIKTIKGSALPTLAAAANLYYINPSSKFIPSANTFIAPVMVGATVAWNVDKLWNNKNKLSEAQVKKSEAVVSKGIYEDNIRKEVNQDFQNYQRSLNRVRILENSIKQAEENDRILASKYKNNIASVTDRIDAQTQLFQSQINLELAKAESGLAWYTLLKSTGRVK